MSPANSLNPDVTHFQVSGLIERLDSFIDLLRQQNNLIVQQRIDQFYYMEKAAELRVLTSRVEDLRSTLRVLEEKTIECITTVGPRLANDEHWFRSVVPSTTDTTTGLCRYE